MREFNSKKDRKFLRKLFKVSRNPEINLLNYISDCILYSNRLIKFKGNSVYLVLLDNPKEQESFVLNLMAISSLINILIKEDLIFVHENRGLTQNILNSTNETGISSDDDIYKKINQMIFREWEIPTDLSETLISFANKYIYVRPELREYIKNNFKTNEQLRHDQVLFWTRIAAIASIIGLFIALNCN
jgi:hypothetical protein